MISYLFKIFFIVIFMWVFAILNLFLPFINYYGIHPRSIIGIPGIIFSIFLHADLHDYSNHIINNTLMLLFLLPILASFYEKSFQKIVWAITISTGSLVWLFGRSYNHIGASGLIFGLITFFLFIGIFQRDIKSIFCSFIFFIFYGLIFSDFNIQKYDIFVFLKMLISQIIVIFLLFSLIFGIFQRNIKYLLSFAFFGVLYLFISPPHYQNFEILNMLGKQIFIGFFPNDSNISWEAHTFGAISGILVSYLISKKKKIDLV